MAAYEGISLTCELGEDLPLVEADRIALARVIANLLSNAIKFTPEGGKIILACQQIKNGDAQRLIIPAYCKMPEWLYAKRCLMRFSVKNSGDEIPPEELADIFGRFIQGQKLQGRKQEGAGLGLAYCKLAIESMGGVIWAESITGSGSEFIMLLPCCQ
ncbi:MAG: ATP-binding protein [Deltaproteobacteria bacterium]